MTLTQSYPRMCVRNSEDDADAVASSIPISSRQQQLTDRPTSQPPRAPLHRDQTPAIRNICSAVHFNVGLNASGPRW